VVNHLAKFVRREYGRGERYSFVYLVIYKAEHKNKRKRWKLLMFLLLLALLFWCNCCSIFDKTRMWVYAQRDGRLRNRCALCWKWRAAINVPCFSSLSHTAKFGSRPLLQCLAVTLQIQENARFGRKMNFAPGKIPRAPENVYIVYQPRRQPNFRSCNDFDLQLYNIELEIKIIAAALLFFVWSRTWHL